MNLVVELIEARNLPAMDPNKHSDPYVRLQLGKHKFRTKVVKKCLNPYWGDVFRFRVDDLSDELVVSVMDEDKYFNDDFVGRIKVPVSRVFDAKDKSLGTAWYSLQPKSKKSKNKDCGEICLNINLSQNSSFVDLHSNGPVAPQLSEEYHDAIVESSSTLLGSTSGSSSPTVASSKEDKLQTLKFSTQVSQICNRNGETASSPASSSTDLPELSETVKPQAIDSKSKEQLCHGDFDGLIRMMASRDQVSEFPSNLPGGILLDQLYAIAASDLNTLLFSPDSKFFHSLSDVQGKTELQIGSWKFDNDGENLKRVVTYVNPATKLIKAVKATEDQTYLKSDSKAFAVLASVSTPDVIYGSSFKVEILYCITPGAELPSGEQSSHLVISWRMNFIQSTVMKGMIENGARQGLKDSFNQYASFLSQKVKPIDSKDTGSSKDQALASLQAEMQSDWKLGIQYLANFTVISTFIVVLYVLLHIWLAAPSTIQGLEFVGLDLPDSIGELIVCCVIILQAERVLALVAHFMQARVQKGSDHGIKAEGDGWLLTVALIEGSSLAAVDSTGFSDPYAVFTCNGKARTSSIKFQKLDPIWNEIFEFDAMEEPPSMLDVEVFDFDGPFDDAISLGHAEINFLKTNISDLADVWVPLQGKLAQTCQSKLHLRIFLDNTQGGNAVRDYLAKMGKEVGKKINMRSPQTNSAFQKLFGLPPEEFLINDFTCHLKRKMPLQGCLFLSARIIGFHANLFGHKTKFFFLWEDIEEIQVASPNLSSMGSPIIVITLRKGRGLDARHGAKTQDEEGRLKFHFQSFVSFTSAQRTIMALWKSRSLSPEQKVRIAEEESEARSLESEEGGTFLEVEDVNMSEVYSSLLPVPMNFVMEAFGGGEIDQRVMESIGCLNYSCTPWELDKADVYQRQIGYVFDKGVSSYRGEVISTQQRSPLPDKSGWLIEQFMTLRGVPFGDYFNLHLRYQIEDMPSRSKGSRCHVKVFLGMAWLKSTRHQNRISRNVLTSLQDRFKVMFATIEKEYIDGR
ncbi:hypothetical protein Nepgr_028691 [Nepenthes gracilis]|uniref:C2 and GRAM domain-containing protein n=1 Tax=Nepenthes gracilis TaxID=150966 RepID=A0AAD3Y2M5_NEPGR|nr:hypothetical protein Nepgr_028691 [Nepenthes gracilis]